MHEFDQIAHTSDRFDDIGKDSGLGRIVAFAIEDARAVLSVSKPETLLCLGAGQAYPELALVEALEIPYQNVTLVDKHFSYSAKNRLVEAAPEATLVEDGMFSYLERSNEKRFSLVTTFGLHDVIIKENIDEFLKLLTGVIDNSAIVFIQHKILPAKVIETAKKYRLIPLLSGPFLFTVSHTSTTEV